MKRNALSMTVIQMGNGLLIDTMGRILSDYGFTVIKTAQHTADVSYRSDPSIDLNKILIKDQEQLHDQLRNALGLFVSQDMNNIDSVVGKLSIKYPHLIILVAYRFNPSVSKHETNRQSHDVNIQSLAGILSLFGQTDNPTDNSPQYPSAIATLVGANTGAIQFMKTIYQKQAQSNNSQNRSHQATIIKHSVLHSCMYLSMFNLTSHLRGMIKGPRGSNILDGAAPFYRVYSTKDHYITIANIETKFYEQMLQAMKLPQDKTEYLRQNQLNFQQWPKMKQLLSDEFLKRTTNEWIEMFSKYDTCVSKVENLSDPSKIVPWPRLSRHDPYTTPKPKL